MNISTINLNSIRGLKLLCVWSLCWLTDLILMIISNTTNLKLNEYISPYVIGALLLLGVFGLITGSLLSVIGYMQQKTSKQSFFIFVLALVTLFSQWYLLQKFSEHIMS